MKRFVIKREVKILGLFLFSVTLANFLIDGGEDGFWILFMVGLVIFGQIERHPDRIAKTRFGRWLGPPGPP